MAELKTITMSDIRQEPVEWLWEPYIPSGAITLIQGDGGMGKTTVALAIAAAVSTGTALPGGGGNAAPAAVIVQNAEDSYSKTIKPRLEQLGADNDKIEVILEDGDELSFVDNRIEQAIVKFSAKLIILDPVQAYFGGANMNNANSVRPIMKQLGDVAERNDCAILLVGHLHKKGGQSQYRSLGSIDIYAAARSVLTVGKTNMDDEIRVIVHNKSNLAPPGASQAFGLDPVGGFCWMGEYEISIDELLGGAAKAPKDQLSRACNMIKSMLAYGPVAAIDILLKAEEQDISEKTLKRAKKALGVISIKHGEQWFWDFPIDVEFTEAGQEKGQEGQEGHAPTLTPLALLPEAGVM
jgi:KaiC/GvpD/RAD55 family RecA-like ATPase